jgi:hypothetical protein
MLDQDAVLPELSTSGAESGSVGSESANQCNLGAISKNAILLYPLEAIEEPWIGPVQNPLTPPLGTAQNLVLYPAFDVS